mgnify:CR=1 FL=1
MTTDTNNDAENTVEEKQKEREIAELLRLDTYQGMTDGEIQKVIDWYVDRAHNDEEVKSYRLASQSMAESHEQAVSTILATSESVLESIIASATNYQGVTQLAVTDLLTEKGEV